MNFHPTMAALVVATALGMVGCARNTLPPETSAALPNHRVAKTEYACDDGTTRTVRYPDAHTAIVPYQGTDHRLNIAVSADGARYTDDSIEWWSVGSGPNAEASLFKHSGNGKTSDVIARCHQTASSRTDGSNS